ncbi:MAG: glycosyltransferase [Caldilineaceae bacterium]|nr:glycosyltransferase [Caldilineaceae bacterium]
MKFALVGPVHPYRGGIAHYTTLLSKALREQQQELLLISFRRQYPSWLFPGRTDRDPSRVSLSAEAAHYWIDSLNPLTWLTTFGRIWRYRPQVLILQWWTAFWVPVWLTLLLLNRLLLGCTVVWICHNVTPHEATRLERWLARVVLRWGALRIVHSTAEQAKLQQLLPGVESAVVAMPTFPLFTDRIPQAQARAALELPTDQTILLFFGLVRPYKGLRFLVEALPLLRQAEPQLTLVIAGEFWQDQKAEIRALIEQLHLTPWVRIDDRYIPDEEVSRYFSAADLLVAPYQRVTGSAVVQAALAFGMPIITTSVVHATLPAAQAAQLVDWVAPGDAQALAQAILAYLCRPPVPPPPPAMDTSWAALVALLQQPPTPHVAKA